MYFSRNCDFARSPPPTCARMSHRNCRLNQLCKDGMHNKLIGELRLILRNVTCGKVFEIIVTRHNARKRGVYSFSSLCSRPHTKLLDRSRRRLCRLAISILHRDPYPGRTIRSLSSRGNNRHLRVPPARHRSGTAIWIAIFARGQFITRLHERRQ